MVCGTWKYDRNFSFAICASFCFLQRRLRLESQKQHVEILLRSAQDSQHDDCITRQSQRFKTALCNNRLFCIKLFSCGSCDKHRYKKTFLSFHLKEKDIKRSLFPIFKIIQSSQPFCRVLIVMQSFLIKYIYKR